MFRTLELFHEVFHKVIITLRDRTLGLFHPTAWQTNYTAGVLGRHGIGKHSETQNIQSPQLHKIALLRNTNVSAFLKLSKDQVGKCYS